jgi:hypothetical protein
MNPEAPFDGLNDHWKPPSPSNWWWVVMGILFGLIMLGMIGFAFAAQAHDHKRPDLNSWYAEQKNDNGVPCCDGSEATRIANVDWQSACKGNECRYQVFIGGQWWDVPDWAVVKSPNMDGETLVWPIYYWRDGKPENGLSSVFIRCFMPGAGG